MYFVFNYEFKLYSSNTHSFVSFSHLKHHFRTTYVVAFELTQYNVFTTKIHIGVLYIHTSVTTFEIYNSRVVFQNHLTFLLFQNAAIICHVLNVQPHNVYKVRYYDF